MFEFFDNDSIRRILRVRRRDRVPAVELRRRPCLTCIPASHVAQTSWRPAEDMGNQDHGRPETALRAASLQPRTMEKGLGESAW